MPTTNVLSTTDYIFGGKWVCMKKINLITIKTYLEVGNGEKSWYLFHSYYPVFIFYETAKK